MDTRPPPGAPPSYAFVTRVYRRNLRPIVISFAFLGGLWALFSGVGFFRNAPLYSANGSSKLATFSVILGILYMVVLGIEVFGMFAALSQKVPFVRIYAYLSGLVTLVVAAAGLFEIVIHFTLKNEIISTCTNANEGDTVFFGSIFGPVRSDSLTRDEANDWCNRAWSRGSWSDIIAFLLTTFLAGFFAMMTFGYLRQVLDPSHPANVVRQPNQNRGDYPSHYNPPYNPTYNPTMPPYGGAPTYYPQYAPPTGPPPGRTDDPFADDNKPPGYIRGDDYKGGFGDMQKGDDGPSERDVTSPKTAAPRQTNPFV